jgi:putative component of toxin-antitoxin plasmid stabilization module
MRIRIGNRIYYMAENAIGMITLCGIVRMGIDGEYIEWLA